MQVAPFAARRHARPPRAELLRIVTQVLQAGLAGLAPAETRGPDRALVRACRSALERLWDRREALARSLRVPPTADALEDFHTRTQMARLQEGQERSVVQLNAATSLAALVLRNSMHSTSLPNTPVPTDARWPFSPQSWAMALRRVVQLATPEHAVRIELMRIGTRLLCPHFVDAWRRTTFAANTRRRRADALAPRTRPGSPSSA